MSVYTLCARNMSCFTEEQLNRISHLIKEIEKLSDVEKLFLYLQLPSGKTDSNANNNGNNNNNTSGSSKMTHGAGILKSELFSKKPDMETTQTYTWILSHLEVDPSVSLPKQEVYDEYRAFCQSNRFEPLCVADFGKAMKHAFPCIKPRRLGQRGNSRYCYSGLRKKYKIQPPILPDMIEPTFCMDNDCSQAYNQIIKDCRDNPDECPLNHRTTFSLYQGDQQPQQHAPPQQQIPPSLSSQHAPSVAQLHSNTNTPSSSNNINNNNNNNNNCSLSGAINSTITSNNNINYGYTAHSWLDSSASPFQSPASTPYPSATYSGYVTHQDMIQDYYSDDCSRYT